MPKALGQEDSTPTNDTEPTTTPEPEISSGADSEPSVVDAGGSQGGGDPSGGVSTQVTQPDGRDERLAEMEREREEYKRQVEHYRKFVPYAEQYLQNAGEFQAWKDAQRRAQAEASQPKKQKFWNPPEVREEYKRYIVDGQIAADAPLDAKQQLSAYAAYTQEFARKFIADPESTLAPLIEDIARSQAEQLFNQGLNQHQEQLYVRQLEQSNRDWLYDAGGNPTPEGRAIAYYIQEANGLGIRGAQAKWLYATNKLELDLLRSQGVTQPQAQPQAPATPQAQMLQQQRELATRKPNRNGTEVRPQRSVPQNTRKVTFEDRLAEQARSAGLLSATE